MLTALDVFGRKKKELCVNVFKRLYTIPDIGFKTKIIYCRYFLPLLNRKITSNNTIPTRAIPAQTPALKIPAIAEQPGSNNTMRNNKSALATGTTVFMACVLDR